jgi:lipopolysaccharide biosynthesis glycosyltransferase
MTAWSGTRYERKRGVEPINVVLAADTAFRKQLAVTIAGISHFGSETAHRIFVLHDGYGSELRQQVARSAGPRVTLEWIDATSRLLGSAILPDYLPTATLYRLRLTDLLPPDVGRVLFIDTDVVVRNSLSELWATELGDAPLAAVRDAVYPWAASPACLDWRSLQLPPDMPYFNAGVMLIPVDRWRRSNLGGRALALMSHHVFRYGDQCALNTVARGGWKALSPHWNVQSGHLQEASPAWICESAADMERLERAPSIIHYTSFLGRSKPWEPRSNAPHRDLWFEALDRTAWSGWRPDDTPPSKSRVFAQRARRAGGVLIHGT